MRYFPVRLRWPASLDISIVVPVMNEVESIPMLASEVDRVMYDMKSTWECIWIDDGSADGTLEVLQNLQRRDPHHQYISLAQNFGQSAAFAAGFTRARGKLLITLDGDGQNDPADIPLLIDKLNSANCDMVQGVRKNREDNLLRKISSRIGNGYRIGLLAIPSGMSAVRCE